jgi:hypothetical protein
MIPVRSRQTPGPPRAPAAAAASVGPLRLVEPGTMDELADILARAMSLGIIWSPARRRVVLDLASAAAHRRARLYLIGPPDLGQDLGERAWLRDHASRLLSRRGAACAADLLLLNSGSDRSAVLFLHEAGGPRSFWIWLSDRQAEAAADWFSHLFWHQTSEEGRAHSGGYRFQRCGAPPFVVPALAPESLLWLTQASLPIEAPEPGALVHDPESPSDGDGAGLPPFAVGEERGCIDARAAGPGWSLRLRLEAGQARDLRAATLLRRAPR